MIVFISLTSTHYIEYDELSHTTGLTAWSVQKAKELFKGSKLNEREGEKVTVEWKLKEVYEDSIEFSLKEMKLMAAEEGDLVYLSDSRKYLGGLKSVHSVFGRPHDEDGIVYISGDHVNSGLFIKNKKLTAEKEM